MGDSSSNPKKNVVLWSWRQGQDEGDTLDGEVVQHYRNKSTLSTNVSDSDSDDDDVDMEEHREKNKKTRQHQQQRQAKNNVNVGKVGVGVNRDHNRMRTPTVVEEVTSVNRHEGSNAGRGFTAAASTNTKTAPRQQFRRRSIKEERQELVRSALRKSLEVPPALLRKVRFGVSKGVFWQQKVPIFWQPIWNCKSVGRLLLILAIFTLPLALWLFFVETRTQEYRFTFGEECKHSQNYLRLLRIICVFCGSGSAALNPPCSKAITIPNDMPTPVFLYYELVGFHQNHRKISKSYDNVQLFGNIFKGNNEPVPPSEDCGKYSRDNNGKIYFPCGQLANFMYNDDFSLQTSQGQVVPLRAHGIAHSILKTLRFRNPPIVSPKNYYFTLPFTKSFVKPKDWTKEVWDKWWQGGGMENERFINWMTPSSFGHLRKLYAIIDHVPECPSGVLCRGEYTMNIEYRYDTEQFKGNKAFILATTTFLGGQNYNLPLLVGLVGCCELACGLLLLHIDYMTTSIEHHNRRSSRVKKRRKSDEPSGNDTGTDIENVPPNRSPPPAPQPVPDNPDSSTEDLLVTRIPIVSNTENGGRVSGPRNKSPTEGLLKQPKNTVKKELSTIYWNTLPRAKSQVVLPDDHSDSKESDSEPFYTTEEGETDETDAKKSILVSAAEENSPETENNFRDENVSRKRR